ncbi:hypothetical protein GF373_16790, partial [bacterium]|nr:hypothetical protein [bacterium]
MLDPLAGANAQLISAQAKAEGLAALLKGGAQTGTVVSQQADGKATISFQGKSYTLNTQGMDLQAGRQVLARLVGDQILLQLLPQKGEGQAAAGGAEASRGLATQLANMGVTESNAQVIAQALLKAGMPLDQTALKELANLLPQAQANQMAALSFLMGRGLPINPTIAMYFIQLFSPKPKPSANANKLLDNLKKAERDFEEEDELPISPDQRRELKKRRQDLEHHLPAMRQWIGPHGEQELENHARAALTSPETALLQLQEGGGEGLHTTLVKLLSLLMKLQPFFIGTPHADLFASLIHQATELHETLVGQAVKNLPHQSGDSAPYVFFQIPYMDEGQLRDLDVKYREKRKDKKAGVLDVRLEMSKLGPLQVSIQWDHPNLSLSLAVTNEKAAQFLEGALGELKQMLTDKGFHVNSIGVIVADVPDTLAEEEEMEPDIP